MGTLMPKLNPNVNIVILIMKDVMHKLYYLTP